MIRNLFLAISLFNLHHTSTSLIVTFTSVTTQRYSFTRPAKNIPSNSQVTTSTAISASRSSSPITKDDANCEQLETLLDETLSSNSTAASYLLSTIHDEGDGLVVDQLLELVEHLPTWTKVRLLGKFSRRARRASLRRILNLSDGGTDTVLAQRKALVSVLRSIAGSSDNDDKALQSGSSGGIAIWDIERDARRESKNTTPGSEHSNSEELSSSSVELEKGKMVRGALKAKSPEILKKEAEVLARTLEHKIDATNVERAKIQFRNELKKETMEEEEKEREVVLWRATEKVGVQTIENEENELEALKKAEEERKTATQARATDEARRQASKDQDKEFKAEKRMKQENEAAEQARLRLITYELNQRALLEYRLELDRIYRARETEIKIKQEASVENLRMITNERNQRALLEFRLELDNKCRKLEITKQIKQEAAEQVKQRMITNEHSQRSLLESRLELERKYRQLKAEKRYIVNQEVEDKADALKKEAKDGEALNAELERKKNKLPETSLKLDTSDEDIERKQAITAELESNKKPLRRENEVIPPSHDGDIRAQSDEKDDVIARNIRVMNARRQPKSEEERKALVEKYGSMEIGLRAYTILGDLGMLESSKV